MSVAIPSRELDNAEAVSVKFQPHSLGINSHEAAELEIVWQVAKVQMNTQSKIPD